MGKKSTAPVAPAAPASFRANASINVYLTDDGKMKATILVDLDAFEGVGFRENDKIDTVWGDDFKSATLFRSPAGRKFERAIAEAGGPLVGRVRGRLRDSNHMELRFKPIHHVPARLVKVNGVVVVKFAQPLEAMQRVGGAPWPR